MLVLYPLSGQQALINFCASRPGNHQGSHKVKGKASSIHVVEIELLVFLLI
jgi:hypothetical protein